MTERTTNIAPLNEDDAFRKLSIQVSLNGLSFCVLDTLIPKLLAFENVTFKTPATPYALLEALKSLLHQNAVVGKAFSEVTVIHKNPLFSVVPKPLFRESELPNYLKFNAKLMANDHIAHEEIPHQDIVNVYVPYTNVNNYIFDCFGAFEFKHSGTVLITTLLSQSRTATVPVCYVHLAESVMEMAIVSEKKLLLYNQFEYNTPEDFLYYLLFSFEQVHVDVEKVQLQLFGQVAKGDAIYEGCYRYVKNVSVAMPKTASSLWEGVENQGVALTLLSVL